MHTAENPASPGPDRAPHRASSDERTPVLVGDVGGTNSRFGCALLPDRALAASAPPAAPQPAASWTAVADQRVLRNDDHSGLVAAIRAYLAHRGDRPRPRRAAIAVACPVAGDEVRLTNRDWAFSIAAARQQLDLDELLVLNDFSALALALPHLDETSRELWHPGTADPAAPLGVLGAGTGLGVGGVLPSTSGWIPLATEGGHRDLAATTEREWQVHQELAARFGHVSAERVLSGPGLAALYEAVARVAGQSRNVADPADVAPRAAAGDEVAREALELFAAWLGAVAGDLALTLGARGGMYLAGGIVPKLGDQFRRDLFLARYLAKGRFRTYVETIPLWLVTHPTAALLGAAAALAQR
jgi:glucokinase